MKMKRWFFAAMFILFVWALTLSAEETLLPYYVEVESLSTNLIVHPSGSGEADYDANIGQDYTATVFVENVNPFPIDSVCVKLSGSINTMINGNPVRDSIFISSLGPYEAYHLNYDVVYLVPRKLSLPIDSLYAHIVYGRDPSGDLIGEQVVDNDLFILMERPAHINAYFFAPDSVTVPQYPLNNNYVTEGQPFKLLFEWANVGGDIIDSVKFSLARRDAGSHSSAHSTILDTLVTFHNIAGGDTVRYYFDIVADDTVDIVNPVWEYFVVNLEGSWAQNTGEAVLYNPSDTLARVGIQQPPDLTLESPILSSDWLNKLDTLQIKIPVSHPGAPYAEADLFIEPDYPFSLHLFGSTVSGVGGLGAPYAYPASLYGDVDTFYFALYNIK